jgi:hypothetical protein
MGVVGAEVTVQYKGGDLVTGRFAEIFGTGKA